MKYYLIAVTDLTGRKIYAEQRADYDSLFVLALNEDFTVAETYQFSPVESERWCDLCGLSLNEGEGDEGLCRKCAERLETEFEGRNS